MKALKTALYSKMAGSAFGTSIGNRLYDRVPQNPTWPYVYYFFPSVVPNRMFMENIRDIIVQFSIFSSASGQTEILDINANLISLYDGVTLSPTGEKVILMELASGEGEVTDYPADTPMGTGAFFQSDVDFNIIAQKN